MKTVNFHPNRTKQSFLEEGFVEISVGVAPERTKNIGYDIQAQRKQYGLKHNVSSTIHQAMGETLPSVATEVSMLNASFIMWDKGQMIVITSRTKYAWQTIFVGDKDETLNALRHLLTVKTQWTEYIEEVLRIITINLIYQNNILNRSQPIFTSAEFPYRRQDMTLPQCNTGYVYMIIPLRNFGICYIGKTISIRDRLTNHNSLAGGSATTIPNHLKPYILFAYVCGFNGNNEKMFYVERRWKEERQKLVRNGNNSFVHWARCVLPIISQDYEGYKELTLVQFYDDL